jgi:xanthine dehydrogenase YagS FAD-binding subunit
MNPPSELRAGATDVQDRYRLQLASGPFIDLLPTRANTSIAWDGGARIGALVRLQAIALDPALRRAYPAFSAAAGGLATPQIRAVATAGGALLQRSRCWYYRQTTFDCFRKGGTSCPARLGDHRFGAAIDLGPCVSSHPATMGVALAAYDGLVETEGGRRLSVGELYGDGTDPSCDHHLPAGDVLAAVILPPPGSDERGAYKRAIGRELSEWPLVEVAVRLQVAGDRIIGAGMAAGAVANIPLRLAAVERALVGARLADAPRAAEAATVTGAVLPGMAFKLDLLRALVADVISEAIAGGASPPAPQDHAVLPWKVNP